jgi:hypothetical protein
MQQHMDEIIPNLFIGNQRSSEIYGSQFDLIVNCTPHVPFPASPKPGCRLLRIAIGDHPSLNPVMYDVLTKSPVLGEILTALQQQKKVLVHCVVGMQRSCAVVASFFIKNFSLPVDTAMAVIKQRRPIAFYGGATFQDTLTKLSTLYSIYHDGAQSQ